MKQPSSKKTSKSKSTKTKSDKSRAQRVYATTDTQSSDFSPLALNGLPVDPRQFDAEGFK